MGFQKIGRIGLFEGRLICVLDGVGGYFFEGQALRSMKDGCMVGEVAKSKSGRAVNVRLAGRMFTAAWADLVRVVRNGGKAAIFEVA
ncbi:MAG: hypothetical protein PHP59_04370 [Methanofollis sp.]|uniref:hypothetical protein n=1 Tax=Methanofollis sp. TaxID=2052835 RepID=UPI00262E9A23|nr:hypothetical protein [Methanofollis sp.]MDD4254594.1 hypothetical protein [Methanofollis sp.]